MNEQFSIEGKVAVVTGGSGVLGSNISKGFIAAGAKVFIIGAHSDRVDSMIGEIETQFALGTDRDRIDGTACNVLDFEALQTVREAIVGKWGRIDILVNAAGGNIPGANVPPESNVFKMSKEALNQVVDLNLYGTVYPSLVFGEQMAKQGEGSIVNVSSMAATSAMTRVPGYSIAKNGVEIFTKWMAMEMAQKFSEKIRVNAIAPGFFIGHQNKAVLINPDGSLTDRSRKVIAKTPMGRFGDISELNGAVQFLCSPAASFITGVVLPVDGGFSSYSGV